MTEDYVICDKINTIALRREFSGVILPDICGGITTDNIIFTWDGLFNHGYGNVYYLSKNPPSKKI